MGKPWNYLDNKDLHSFHSCQDLFCIRTAHSNIPPWTMSNLIYCLLFVFTFPLLSSSFQVFVHSVEKIIFISCQSLAVRSYVRQNSIKLSYTGMKLQNRPGTPKKKKNHISSLPTYRSKKDGRIVIGDLQNEGLAVVLEGDYLFYLSIFIILYSAKGQELFCF